MTFADIYQQPPGAPPLPGPPVDLPRIPGRQPTRFTVTKAPKGADHPDGAWASQVEDYKPPAAPKPEDDGAWAAAQPDHGAPSRQVGTGEAIGTGFGNAFSFGFAPALEGIAAASGEPAPTTAPERASGSAAARPIMGAVNLVHNYLSEHPDPEIRDAYQRGRQAALENEQLAQEQHPWAYGAGQVAGAVALPLPGVGTAANIGGRAARGALAGGIGGGLYGAGSAVSKDEDLAGIGKEAATGAAIGAPLGGLAGAVLGPRVAGPLTSGRQAAQTAEALGAPIPKGIASDSRAIRSTTGALSSVPFMGARVHNALDATREAAGEAIGQSGVDQAIATNRGRIDALYDNVRNQIDPDRVMPMPRTSAAVGAVRARRVAKRQPKPDQGLEQFQNIGTQGASFNGAHGARSDAREAGDVLSPHPGYNAADYNRITRAMTADIRANVHAQGGGRALRALDRAERQFGPMADANRILARIAHERGRGAGLDALGFNPATGEFSLDKFVTAWNKLNPEARPFVPEPAHAANIEDIFQMGTHIKGSMRERSTSHSAGPLIMLDLARDAILTGVAVGTGTLAFGSVAGSLATVAPAILFAHWLASPATAAAMGAWARAYRGVTMGHPAPARLAVFNIATRNLANNLHIPAQQIMERVARSATGMGQDGNNPHQVEAPRPVH